MKFLLDTCLLSELVKKEPNAAVIRWVEAGDEQNFFLSVLTPGELQKGISKLRPGVRKEELQAWVGHDLLGRFAGRILDLDWPTVMLWGKLQGEAEQQGDKLPVMDSLLAATALVHGLVVVTRNVKDFARCQVRVFNPWGN